MIIHPDEYNAYWCPPSMSREVPDLCRGPKCMAWEELPSVPDKSVIPEEKITDRSPGPEWLFVAGESLGYGKGYAPNKYVKYRMVRRATCGMIPKDEINVYQQ